MKIAAMLISFMLILTSCDPILIDREAFDLDRSENGTQQESIQEDGREEAIRYYLVFEKDRDETVKRLKREIKEEERDGSSDDTDDDETEEYDQG